MGGPLNIWVLKFVFQYTITSYRLKSTGNILTLLQLPTNYLKKFTSTSDQPESVTGDRKSLTFLSRLNEAANVQEINSVVMNEVWKWTGRCQIETKNVWKIFFIWDKMAATYHPYKIALSYGQKKLQKAFAEKSAVTYASNRNKSVTKTTSFWPALKFWKERNIKFTLLNTYRHKIERVLV